MNINLYELIVTISNAVVGWPLIIFVTAVGLLCTLAYNFIQVRYFVRSWGFMLKPDGREKGEAELSPLQAFLNSLSASLGNGSIAGVATAIYSGGPGSVFWMVAIGFFLMAIRFAEVYLSIYYQDVQEKIGGPMIYLKRLLGGQLLSYLYAFFALAYAFTGGNAIQANSVSVSLQKVWAIPPMAIAVLMLVFTLYIMLGGARRILAVSDAIVPVKVVLFFFSSLIVLLYHYQALGPAIKLIFTAALSPQAAAGGLLGYTVQQAVRFGMFRCIMATEAGLGTSGILFGATESKEPVKDGIMSMLTVFISTLVCFMVGLCIVASGVWQSGLTSTALTIASFETVFGELGGWVVSALSISFGIGLVVTYAFVAREVWFYLSGGRFAFLFSFLYCLTSFGAALVDAHVVWYLADIVNAGMLLLNLTAIVSFTPVIRQGLASYEHENGS